MVIDFIYFSLLLFFPNFIWLRHSPDLLTTHHRIYITYNYNRFDNLSVLNVFHFSVFAVSPVDLYFIHPVIRHIKPSEPKYRRKFIGKLSRVKFTICSSAKEDRTIFCAVVHGSELHCFPFYYHQ